jgi:hypothetical protein
MYQGISLSVMQRRLNTDVSTRETSVTNETIRRTIGRYLLKMNYLCKNNRSEFISVYRTGIHILKSRCYGSILVSISDVDLDPHVFGPLESESVHIFYGS